MMTKQNFKPFEVTAETVYKNLLEKSTPTMLGLLNEIKATHNFSAFDPNLRGRINDLLAELAKRKKEAEMSLVDPRQMDIFESARKVVA